MAGTLMLEDIKKRLNGIFKARFGVDLDAIQEDFGDKKLLGREFGMPPRDLLYLFFDIEKEFGITIPQEAVASGELSTYNGICSLIGSELGNE